MSGNLATDYSDQATGCVLDVSKRTWSQEILDAADLSIDLFPELHESTDRLGELTREAAKELGLPPGIPLIVGSGDAPASAAGALAVNPGDVYFYIGSAAWGGSIESRPVGDFAARIIVLPHVVPGLYHSQVVMNTGAIAQQWAVENLYGKPTDQCNYYEQAMQEAAKVPLEEDTILFLPFLRGGGAPFNNLNARGVFSGVAIEHTRGHLFRAVLEGFAFKLRYVIERFERFREEKIDRFAIIGGGARNSFWMKLIANITGKDVVTTKLKQASNCFAAATLAGIGTGLLESFQSLDRKQFYDEKFSPDGTQSDFYEHKYEAFLRAYEGSIEVFEILTSLKEKIS
jgi:xylulokinase